MYFRIFLLEPRNFLYSVAFHYVGQVLSHRRVPLSRWAFSARGRLVRVASRTLRGVFPEPKRLRWGTVRKDSYWPTHRDAGFFSICSTTLGDLGSLEGSVSRIFANKVFRQYRALPRMNSWSLFFRQPSRNNDGLASTSYVSTLV